MHFPWKKPKTRTADVLTVSDSLSGLLNDSGVSPEMAMEIPAVSACVRLLSSMVAMLPIRLYAETAAGEATEEIAGDNRLSLLNDATGDLLDPYQMREALVRDYLLYGSAYLYPEWNGNSVISLRYIARQAVSEIRRGDDPIYKMGEFILSNGRRLRDDELICLLRNTKDGLKGISPIREHQQLLSAMYRQMTLERVLASSGGGKKGFLESERRLEQEALDELRRRWRELYAKPENAMMVLNQGIKFHEAGATSVEMQLNELKTRNNELACQIFGLSPQAVQGQLSDDALASVVKTAVAPILSAFEAALNKGLLLPSERESKYFAFDTSELLKGDVLKRFQAYEVAIRSNVMQIDEARYRENLPALGLTWVKLGLQDVLYDPKTQTIYTPNTNQYGTMTEAKKPEERLSHAFPHQKV
jgi:HK97 family phage portal protein